MDQAEPQPDFYTRLLGIAPGKRPPNYYELLGLALFTSNPRWIESAVGRRMEELDQFALHPDAAVRRGMQDLVTQVAQARVCLVDVESKRKYDRELAASLGLNTETVDLPAPRSRRKIAAMAAMAVCAAVVIGGAIVAAHFRPWRGNWTAKPNGAGNAPIVVVANAPANQPAGIANQPVSVANQPADDRDSQQKEIDALVAQAGGLRDAGQFQLAMGLLNQALAIRSSPRVLSEIKKVQDAGAHWLAQLLAQAEATLGAMPPNKAALSPAQRDQLKQLRQSLDAPAAANAQAAALRDRIDAYLGPPNQPPSVLEDVAKKQRDKTVADLIDQGQAILKALGPAGTDVTDQQKAKLAEALKLADQALALKENDAQALTLRGSIESFGLAPSLALDLGHDVSLKLALAPAGEFVMGRPERKGPNFWQAGNQHKEQIASPMYVGIYSVTQAQWKAIMDTEPWTKAFMGRVPAKMAGDDYPAMSVTYDDAVDFCRRASKKTGRIVRLPTEAQREYACRAGSAGQFCYGDDPTFEKLGDYAWFAGTTQDERYAHPVGLKKPNAFGLYDMHGNVLEYCLDPWPPPPPTPSNPFAVNGKMHHLRGGCWNCNGAQCQSDYQCSNNMDGTCGFRVFVDVSRPDPAWDNLTRQMDENDRACVRWVSEARGQLAWIPQAKGSLNDMERSRLRAARKAVLAALACSPRDEGALAIKDMVDDAWSRFMEVEIEVGELEGRTIHRPGFPRSTTTVTMRLVMIPSGEFTMGSPPSEKGRQPNEGPQRTVTISKPFYMGVYSVTGEQLIALMGTDPTKGRSTLNGSVYPVTGVSWDDAVEFCRALSKKTGRNFHLPTEAQREYACRAGATTPYFYGDDPNALKLNDYAWSAAGRFNAGFGGAREVGKLKPNDWGLYDMLANVAEWCSDRYAEQYDPKDCKDPIGPEEGDRRVVRGAFDGAFAPICRCAWREGKAPDQADRTVGFRVVMDLDGSGGVPAAGGTATKPDKSASTIPVKEAAPKPRTWRLVNPRTPWAKEYFQIYEDGTVTSTVICYMEKARQELSFVEVVSFHLRDTGEGGMNGMAHSLLQEKRKLSVNGQDYTVTKIVGDTADKEFKAATVRGTNKKVPGVWTLRSGGKAEKLTFYDNSYVVSEEQMGNYEDWRYYRFYRWRISANRLSILADGKVLFAFSWPLSNDVSESEIPSDRGIKITLTRPDGQNK